ncbi:MAG: acyl carrier protein [Gammaproteobacteria bacterium RIFCSPHIGHO2_12_FULL_35_23]|nr:MAG: acyl carrier protein [Gammaproteobacteria bacterium RIFCSPHIGHO2_12_FULL_35_23]
MITQTDFQQKIAELIVESLKLDKQAEDIDPQAPLFGEEGLELDSIDILELAFAISKRYGITIKSGDSNNIKIFANLAALSDYIQENKKA